VYQKGWKKVQETGLGFCFKGVQACSRIEGLLRHKDGLLVWECQELRHKDGLLVWECQELRNKVSFLFLWQNLGPALKLYGAIEGGMKMLMKGVERI